MKRIICLLLIVSMLFVLISCKKTNDGKADDTKVQDTEANADDTYEIKGKSTEVGLEYDYDDLSVYIKVPDYKNLTVTSEKITATESQISAAINAALQNAGTSVDVTGRGAKEGDTVVFTGQGTFADDGTSFNISDETSITIGSGDSQGFADGFDDNFFDCVANETLTFTYTYSADYSYDNFAGRTVTYSLNIAQVKYITPAKLNDDFVKGLGIDGVDNVDEYKEYVKTSLENYTKEQDKQNIQNKIYEKLLSESEVVEYPEKELQYYYDLHDKTCSTYATATAVTVEQYQINEYGSVEEYEKTREEESKASVKKDLIVNLIARDLGIEVKDEEYEEALRYGYENYGAQRGMNSLEDFEKAYSSDLTIGLLTVSVLEELYKTVKVEYK